MSFDCQALFKKLLPSNVQRHAVTDRASWLSLRKHDVTASVAAALVGEHPYQTRLGLHALKTGQMPDAEVEPVIEENSISLPPMLRGTVLEPVAPKLIQMLRPQWEVQACQWYYRDPAFRLGATPDFLCIDMQTKLGGIIQFKTTDHRTFDKVWKTEDGEIEPPLFIAIQAVIEAVLTGASWAQVAVMVSGSTLDLHLAEIPLHRGVMERLRTESIAFWRDLEAGKMPPADYGRDAQVLAALYREDNGEELDLRGDAHWLDLVDERDQRKAVIKAEADRVAAIDTEFKARLGNYESARIADRRRVTWSLQQRRQRFVAPSETRVLRFGAAPR